MSIFTRRLPIKMLVGTDWWTDCDDAVAMRILVRAHLRGKIEIQGIGINACMEHSVVSLDAFLRSEGLPCVPLGIDLAAVDFGGHPPYQKRLAQMPSRYKGNADCDDAVLLYRKILQAADEKIDVIEIGYPQVIANLLRSKPDNVSQYTGQALVEKKVRKLWIMAGNWESFEGGRENNFARNGRAAAAANYLCLHWPAPITFLGWETADKILTGDKLSRHDVLYHILCDHGSPKGRCSWDPMLAHMACIGDEKRAGYRTISGTAGVCPASGVNYFTPGENGLHKIVVKERRDAYYKRRINRSIASK